MLKENETGIFLVAYPRVYVHKPSVSLCSGWWCVDKGKCQVFNGVHIFMEGKEGPFGDYCEPWCEVFKLSVLGVTPFLRGLSVPANCGS